MPIDLKALKKLESLPPSAAVEPRDDDEEILVLIKLRDGAEPPTYIDPRASVGSNIFTAEIHSRDLVRLEADPDVVSVSVSRRLPLT